ncbi:MAG: hypothetical protein Q7S92_05480 [Candidatus Diapherotrites archaeon]|nr:hypothetical protein [Candidatus Diapherotrites archaeon]
MQKIRTPQKRRIPGQKKIKVRPRRTIYDTRPQSERQVRFRGYYQQWSMNAPWILRQHLKLDSAFFSSLRSETRVLEIGSGTGRLTDYLLKRTPLKPENYELLDIAYGEYLPYLKGKIYRLIKAGKLKASQGNMFTHKYSKKFYDHILVPEAYFPMNGQETLSGLVEQLMPALRENGALRITTVRTGMARTGELTRLEKKYQIEVTSEGGLIIRHKK